MNEIINLLILTVILIILGGAILGAIGYAFGRTFTQEVLFQELRESKKFNDMFFGPKLKYKHEQIIPEDETMPIEDIYTLGYLNEEDEFIEVNPDNYPGENIDNRRIDIGRRRAFLLMKIGEMFSCPWCLSAEIALWLGVIIGLILSLTLGAWQIFAIGALAGMVGVCYTYLFNDWLNLRNANVSLDNESEIEVLE